MRVIKVHNYYQEPGGEDQSFAAECDLLESHGHQVERFTAHNDEINRTGNARAAMETIWNFRRGREMRELVSRFKPDIVHVDNTFMRLSPAVIAAASSEGAAVVQSLRNYRLICANALMLRQGRICTDCVGKSIPWPSVLHSCYRSNIAASAVVASMQLLHRVRGTWWRDVHAFIALTPFVRDQFIGSGLPHDRIHVKPNFLAQDPGVGGGRDNSVLFVGRLSQEKGVATLLEAWQNLRSDAVLRIVGDGPMASDVKAAALQPGIEWFGRQSASRVLELVGRASVLVVPSIWYEPFGRVVIEAYARGTPVVVSDIGGLAQLVNHGETGLLFEPGNAGALSETIRELMESKQRRVKMGRDARRMFENRYTAAANYKCLLDIYGHALEARVSVSVPL